jgi:8-oxo-dGTP pyrophosphatase MutT (NUDIX family)
MTSLHSVRAAGVLLYYDVNSDSKQGGTNMADPSERRFLLMRHVKRCNLPNGRGDLPKARWDLPKGHCDGKESFRETALREMEEETGITRSQVTLDPEFCFQLRYPVTYRRSGDQVFQKHVCYFLGRLSQKMPVHETEHDSHRWFAWNPPHKIQAETIDPLLSAIADHWAPS